MDEVRGTRGEKMKPIWQEMELPEPSDGEINIASLSLLMRSLTGTDPQIHLIQRLPEPSDGEINIALMRSLTGTDPQIRPTTELNATMGPSSMPLPMPMPRSRWCHRLGS